MSAPGSSIAVAPETRHGVTRPSRPRVLCVDDEPEVLEALRDSLRRRFEIVVTTNGFEALRLLTDRPFHVVLSDVRMPMIRGTRFLTLARKHAPETVRLLLTGQSMLDDAVAAINEGEVFRFLVKPCPLRELVVALESAVAQYAIREHERELAEQTLEGAVRALADIAAAVDPSSAPRAKRIRRLAVELATAVEGTARSRELERACVLVHVGVVGLSPETRAQLSSGRVLRRDQVAEFERLPELAERYLRPIPALASVGDLLTATAQSLILADGESAETPAAARVLRLVLDFDLLEMQGRSVSTALQTLQQRADRYDASLLDTFAEILGID